MVKNPEGNHVVRISIAFGVIDAIAVALRLLARRRSKAAFAADDALIVVSLVPLFAMIVIGHFSVEAGGLGLPTAVNLELGHGPSRISTFLKLMMSGIVTYTLTITLVKLSILVLYRRIFGIAEPKKFTLILGATIMLWFTVALFTNLFQCRPFQAAFDPELLFTNQCINLEAYYRGITASNLCIDVIMLYMPLHMVWGLHLRTRQKIEVSSMFLLGGNVCIAAAMRIVTVGDLQNEDLTYTMAQQYLWSQIEPALAILCACLMTLRPLFVDLHLSVPKLSTRFTRSRSSPSSGTTSDPGLTVKGSSHVQWPGVRESRQKEYIMLSTEGTSSQAGLQTVTVDLETTDRKAPYTQTLKVQEQQRRWG